MQSPIFPFPTTSVLSPAIPVPERPHLSGSDDDASSVRILIPQQFEDETVVEVEPFLSRSSSHSSPTSATSAAANSYQNRRRRSASEPSVVSLSDGSGGGRDQSFRERIRHAMPNMSVMTRLGRSLWRYIGLGYRWITGLLALSIYSFLIFPGLCQESNKFTACTVGFYYYFSPQVQRDIIYGDQPRNKLDLYLPKDIEGRKPVVAFVTGGAWIIGYKAWGSLLGQQLSQRDIIVACIDYRNFPGGTMSDMVKDASEGISFVCNHIAEYGGDPDRIFVMGQSAGAHIAACALLEQAIKEAGEGESTSWSLSQIKAYFGLSGGYNLLNLVDHFHSRGLHRSLFLSIMEGEQSLRRFSPEVVVEEPDMRNVVSLLPPIILFHGTADYSIPSNSSTSFAEALKRVGVEAETILYDGRTHTDVFLQDPMRGGRDQLFEDVVAIIHEGDAQALSNDAVAPPRKRLVPEFMLKLASWISPF